MRRNRKIVTQRFGSVWRDLRGRPAKPDYGVLVVLPFLAAAGGVFLGLALESAVRLFTTKALPPPPADAGPAAVEPAEQRGSTLPH